MLLVMTHERFWWTSSEVEEAEKASVLLAADAIYSDDLTEALFGLLDTLMPLDSEKVLHLTLEKRYNFSLDDFAVVANGYTLISGVIQGTKKMHRPFPNPAVH